jgi:N-formylmaleamate deformylase
MTNRMSGVCKTNGIHIHYLRTGGCKPPLVLLHGLTGNGACWIPLARALEVEYDVVMPDARGHGNSSAPLNGYRYEDHASDVAGLILGLRLVAPVLLGHSMGGMTAALIASQMATAIRGVILADPTFLSVRRQREVHESDVVGQHRRLLSLNKGGVVAQLRVRHPHRLSEIIELLAESRLQTRIHAFDVLTPPNPEYHELVGAIDVPILLVIGDNGVITLETARELQNLNPRLRVEHIQDAGHGLQYDQPDRFEAVVKSFLRSVARTGEGGAPPESLEPASPGCASASQ